MPMKGTNKDLIDLQRLAEEQGWTINFGGGGHLIWTPPYGESVFTSSTPKSSHTLHQIKRDLANAGLILNKAEWRQMKRQRQTLLTNAAHALDEIFTPFEEMETEVIAALEAANVPTPDTYLHIPANLIPMLYSRLRCGRLDLACPCGRQFTHPLGFVNHRNKCNVPDPTPEEQEPTEQMKRDMVNPPDRERLKCSECPSWFWVSQPHLLEQHMAADHGKLPCLYCGEFFVKQRGGLHRHMKVCEKQTRLPVSQPVEELPPAITALPPHKDPIVTPTNHPERIPEPEPEPPEVAAKLDEADALAASVLEDAQRQAEDMIAEARRIAERLANEVKVPIPEPEPTAPSTTQNAGPTAASGDQRTSTQFVRRADATDDELWTLLEVVLDGPIQMNRAAFVAIGEWMDATRLLFALKED